MLSICIITQQYKQVISGIGLHARNLLCELRRDGHRVTLMTQADQVSGVVPDGVEVLTVPATVLQGSTSPLDSASLAFRSKAEAGEGGRAF